MHHEFCISTSLTSGEVGYHVTNSVTETEPATSGIVEARPDGQRTNPNQPGLVHLPPGLQCGTTQAPVREPNDKTSEGNENHEMSIRGHDDETPCNNLTSGSVVMGKLCRRALALIKHKVGADGSVSDHMAQALASWLWRQGITIYTEREL
jgi:hypothetical protein